MNVQTTPTALNQGIYPLPVAAGLAQIDLPSARRWSEGYNHRHDGKTRRSSGIAGLGRDRQSGRVDLTFAEMLTLRLVRAFRATGLSLQMIKRVAAAAEAEFATPTPFVSQRFRTDGRKIFIELRDRAVSGDALAVPPHERLLIDVLSRQHQFADVVEPSLYRCVEWIGDSVARWWPLGSDHAVVLDPKVVFGAPRIAETRLPTDVLASAVRAEGGGDDAIEAVAAWNGLDAAQVRDAVIFETEWLRQAA
jgi:uncharacterized protein (DUF433 family)